MRRHLVHLVLAALVLAGALAVNHAETNLTIFRAFVVTGTAGEWLPVWPGSAVVHGARAAKILEGSDGEELRTQGVWVAVDLSVAGGDQEGPLAQVWLVDADGRRFDASERVQGSFMTEPQPASPVRSEVVFEIPEDSLGRLTVVVGERYQARFSQHARVRVVVDTLDPEPLVPAPARLEEPLP